MKRSSHAGHALGSDRIFSKVNILSGLKLGLGIATFFSLWVLIVRLLLGAGGFERYGIGWVEVVAVYYLGLSLGGCAYGALLPLRRFALGSALLGFLLVLPMYLGISVALGLALEADRPLKADLVVGTVLAAFVGSVFGLWEWIDHKKESTEDSAR